MLHDRLPMVIVAITAGCKPGYRRVRTVEELPAGKCVAMEAGERCERGARDYSAGVSVGAPSDHASEVATTAWFRWPLFDVSLDERRMRKGTTEFHSLAGGVGTHLRPFALWPRAQRYVDVVVNAGFELGGLWRTSHFEGRGDAYVGIAVDVFAPDIGSLRYLGPGVPGLRIGMRNTWFVQGWEYDRTFELGVIWRWGVPVDLYHHWTYHRGGD